MGKTLVVTGGGRGIGLGISEALCALGHRVIVLARSPEAAMNALGPARDLGPGTLQVVQGDLGTIDSTKACATALREACPEIDVLIHNAGVWPTTRQVGPDGYEQSFVTNHLAPLRLTWDLLDLFADGGGRVVQVSAGLYVKGQVELAVTPFGGNFSALRTYADTKLCNVLCSKILAQRLMERGVSLNAVHPGVIRTGLGAGPGVLGWFLSQVKRFWGTIAEGADAPVYLALDPALEGVSGQFFDRRSPVAYAGPALDDALALAVYNQAMDFVGLGNG